ncbi:MAG TPA: OmpA family protein [Terriglobia bacterium]|nr:OmpA family protein [Terriglobia bacterium]
MILENEPQLRPSKNADENRRNKKSSLGLTLGLVALLGLAAFPAWRLQRLETEMAQLSRQVVQADEKSSQALLHASQAEASAQQAAQQRDQAEQAKAQFQQTAQAATQQAETAQAQAAKAQQEAEQYRQQREAELERLQQALNQIAETRRTAMGLIMTLDSNSIRFDFDKADIKPQYREVLSRVAGALSALKGYRIGVDGYADDVGTEEYNIKLSQRRAAAVRDYLVQAGLDPSILSTNGYGKADPRVSGKSDQARAANRRVEIAIVDSTLGSAAELAPEH